MENKNDDPMTVKLVQEIHIVQSKHAYIVAQLDFMTTMCDLMAFDLGASNFTPSKEIIEKYAIKAYDKIKQGK